MTPVGKVRLQWAPEPTIRCHPLPPQWAGVLSRLALEQERILNPLLDRVRTADHHQLRSLTGLIRNLSRNARNKDEMCESVSQICTHPDTQGFLPAFRGWMGGGISWFGWWGDG